ncbi:hypothetical protein yc1106_08890 [Curvularia clavata]|uniref:Uncharacterized protein n=1 Tax=Curvularia clavata TaxID=95742 RepID=A0A9Q8ZGE3_CURCL|nr:hypothetical protein yc1106_08890 [Curvularia clavata]
MSKRAADSPLMDDHPTKKQKIGDESHETKASPVPESVLENVSQATETVQTCESSNSEWSILNSPTHVQANKVEISNNEDVAATSTKKSDKDFKSQESKTKKSPVSDGFAHFKHNITVPQNNPFWGCKPSPGGPRPDPVQPSARESNGQTNPPLWEDRGYRYKRGSRFVKYFGPIAPGNVEELEANLDQEDLLVVKMMDMRPKSKKDPTPKKTPTVYCYGKKPKDWNNMQSIKALNDRRYQAIDRTTMDAPWTRIEREYLAALLREDPDASIWDLTEWHNERFMNKDFTIETGFGFANLSTGRTVESVRYEYTTYKPLYDAGRAPTMVRWRSDQSAEAKAVRATGRAKRAFGPPSRVLEMAYDAEHGSEDGEEDAPARKRPRKTSITTSFHGDETSTVPFSSQQKLSEDEESLLELAGAYDPNDCAVASPAPEEQIRDTEVSKEEPEPTPNAEQNQEAEKKDADASISTGVSDQMDSTSAPEELSPERRDSLHIVRKIEIDEDYDEEDDYEL